MAGIQAHRRTLGGVPSAPAPAPVFWFDTAHGLASDLSTWASRIGGYTASQPNPARRFYRIADTHPNWLGTRRDPNNGATSSEMGIDQPIIASNLSAFTVIVQAQYNVYSDAYAQGLIAGPDLSFYIYKGNGEFFVPDDNGAGSNPAVTVVAGQYGVLSGDAKLYGQPSSSRAYWNKGDINSILYNRYGTKYAFHDGQWHIGGSLQDGRIKGFLFFDRELSRDERFAWVDYLNNQEYN